MVIVRRLAALALVATPAVPALAQQQPAGDATPGAVDGTLAAKPGTRLVLQRGQRDSLVVVARADGAALVTSTAFAWSRAADGDAGVTIRRAPAGVRCATAQAPGAPLRIACGPQWEHATRGASATELATYYNSYDPVIGGDGAEDGRYVAFTSDRKGIAGASGRQRQVFWRDRWTNTTRLVSVTADGTEADGGSGEPAISADGRHVAFASNAKNLPGADANGYRDVFVWHAETGKVERVSTTAAGAPADGESSEPAISADGSVIVFASSSKLLAGGPRRTSGVDVYRKDMRTGEVTLLSREERSRQGAGGARPSVSDDGTRVAFHSSAALRDDDRNGLWDIYLWERGAPRLRRLSMTMTGAERDQGDESMSRLVAPQLSGDGRWVSFATTARTMGGEPTTGQQVYVVEVETGRVQRASADASGRPADGDAPLEQGRRVPLSRDGRWIAFATRAKNLGGNVILKSLVTGETIALSEPPANVGQVAVSRDGLFVLVPTDVARASGQTGTFVRLR